MHLISSAVPPFIIINQTHMPILDPAQLQYVDKPELIFGLVAPVGTPLDHLSRVIAKALEENGYYVETVRLSDLLDGFNVDTPAPVHGASEYDRISTLMRRGTELRQRFGGGEALALAAAAHVNGLRNSDDPRDSNGKAYMLRQLKHPDEVIWLRTVYGPAFQLIGVYCPEEIRYQYLHVTRGMDDEQVRDLLNRDRGEEADLGQHVMRTFHHSDVFIELKGYEPANVDDAKAQIVRYLDLLFGNKIIPPTSDEHAMFLANSAALRSVDLSRQVGATVCNARGDVVAVGCNDVPAAGGGQYSDPTKDARDYILGHDANAVVKHESLLEILSALTPGWDKKPQEEKDATMSDAARALASSRLMNLTEFGRAVHAEMEALLAAGRSGVSVVGGTVFTTTFPCHNCAKHIVDAGIMRVVYIEPYPKSLANRLHGDAIAFPEDADKTGKVQFEPFRGVAPRMFSVVFSSLTADGKRLSRKDSTGYIRDEAVGLRVSVQHLTHAQRESIVALALKEVANKRGLIKD